MANEREFTLEVHVRLYGSGNAEAAADALRAYKDTFATPRGEEVEILTVFTDDES